MDISHVHVRDLASYLWARSIAHEHVLRFIVACLYRHHPEAEAALFRDIETLAAGMDASGAQEGVLLDTAVEELRIFGEQVHAQLAKMRAARSAQDARDAAGAAE